MLIPYESIVENKVASLKFFRALIQQKCKHFYFNLQKKFNFENFSNIEKSNRRSYLLFLQDKVISSKKLIQIRSFFIVVIIVFKFKKSNRIEVNFCFEYRKNILNFIVLLKIKQGFKFLKKKSKYIHLFCSMHKTKKTLLKTHFRQKRFRKYQTSKELMQLILCCKLGIYCAAIFKFFSFPLKLSQLE